MYSLVLAAGSQLRRREILIQPEICLDLAVIHFTGVVFVAKSSCYKVNSGFTLSAAWIWLLAEICKDTSIKVL